MPTPPRRRWYQFSLSTILWALVVIALALVAANERWQRAQLQAEADVRRALDELDRQVLETTLQSP